ncbi:hypothetical protein SH668x_003011 [Planctomicrobium sp. SH668]|uniref:hypothetical protein n=1 Tax=Planctomicrobium sp. SH668 TaxID=3448126 RepID=UPI003F5BF62A
MREQLFLKSSLYEQRVEHVFIAEVLQKAWGPHGTTSEVDAFGCHLVLECQNLLRSVQR